MRRQLAASVAECDQLKAANEQLREEDPRSLLAAELDAQLQPVVEQTRALETQLAEAKSAAEAERHERREREAALDAVRKEKVTVENSLKLSQNQLQEVQDRLQTAGAELETKSEISTQVDDASSLYVESQFFWEGISGHLASIRRSLCRTIAKQRDEL